MLKVVIAAAVCAAAGASRAQRPMFWMHIHNAGGTTIRTLAELYGERPIEPATKNWNIAVRRPPPAAAAPPRGPKDAPRSRRSRSTAASSGRAATS